MALVEEIYIVSRSFPLGERFGLTSQLRRAAISIPSNIGEGARRKRQRVLLNHLDVALGSQGEVDVQLELAKRLGFCVASDHARPPTTNHQPSSGFRQLSHRKVLCRRDPLLDERVPLVALRALP